MATPVTEQLNILSQQMQSSAAGLQGAYLQNQQLGLERAKLEAAMNDPIRLLQKQQAQMQMEKIQQEMKTPYNALNVLESRDPIDIQYRIANDVNIKVAEAIAQQTGKVVRYVTDPKDPRAGQTLVGDENGERPISNYEMFFKYGNVYDAIVKANYDPEKALEANMVQAYLKYNEAKKNGNQAVMEEQQKLMNGFEAVINDPKQLLGIYENKLNYLITVDSQFKALNPDYKGMDKHIQVAQDKIKNLVKNIDKIEDRKWELTKIGIQQQFTAQQNALDRSEARQRFNIRLNYDMNKDARDQADKFTKEGIPQLAAAGLKRMGYFYNKETGQWGYYKPDPIFGGRVFQLLSPQFVDNYYNAIGNYALNQFQPGIPVNVQIKAMEQRGIPKKIYDMVRDNTSVRQSVVPTKTGGAILYINH
ncbi:MAG: hypothetical protein BWY21_00598 [Parcubacteria group bacterium ADurb.Bin216]|nr:MAG: hypothetical protein BWY21_00598 [Parcubacteria group bacterium ADurb.Bin216]